MIIFIYRCNTSLLIDYCSAGDKHKYIIIDVGKTFREQVLRWFTWHKIPQIDSVRSNLYEAFFLCSLCGPFFQVRCVGRNNIIIIISND